MTARHCEVMEKDRGAPISVLVGLFAGETFYCDRESIERAIRLFGRGSPVARFIEEAIHNEAWRRLARILVGRAAGDHPVIRLRVQ